MDSLLLSLVLMCWLFLFLGGMHYLKYQREKQELREHLNEVTEDKRYFGSKKKKTKMDKVIEVLSKYADDFSSLGERINFFSESADLEVIMVKAGYPNNLTVARLQGFKIVLVILGVLAGSSFMVLGLPLANIAFVSLPFIGYFLPLLWIRQKAKERQRRIRKDLPDFLDTVSISLQAGSGLDNAIKEVIRYFDGPIREEFAQLMNEIELGIQRETAYYSMIKRNDNQEFQNFLSSLIQGTRLGVPVATTFKLQAEEIRKISIEQVKEQAAKASPKVTLITSLIIAPTVMIMILGLVVLNIIYGDDNLLSILQ